MMSMDISPLSGAALLSPVVPIRGGSNATPPAVDAPAPPRPDEYIPGQPPTPAGLYRVSADENGARKISFDDPAREPDKAPGDPDAPQKAPDCRDKAESCTTDTAKPDREIEQLRRKKTELEQRLRRTENDGERIRLEKQLAKVERELAAKDTDTYRRQHSEVS